MKKSTAQHIFTLNSNILQAVSFARIFSFSYIFRRVGVMVAHKPSKLDDASPVRKRGFDSRTLLSYARSVTAAQRLSVPYWGFQPLGSGSIPDGRAKKIPLIWRGQNFLSYGFGRGKKILTGWFTLFSKNTNHDECRTTFAEISISF